MILDQRTVGLFAACFPSCTPGGAKQSTMAIIEDDIKLNVNPANKNDCIFGRVIVAIPTTFREKQYRVYSSVFVLPATLVFVLCVADVLTVTVR